MAQFWTVISRTSIFWIICDRFVFFGYFRGYTRSKLLLMILMYLNTSFDQKRAMSVLYAKFPYVDIYMFSKMSCFEKILNVERKKNI